MSLSPELQRVLQYIIWYIVCRNLGLHSPMQVPSVQWNLRRWYSRCNNKRSTVIRRHYKEQQWHGFYQGFVEKRSTKEVHSKWCSTYCIYGLGRWWLLSSCNKRWIENKRSMYQMKVPLEILTFFCCGECSQPHILRSNKLRHSGAPWKRQQ